MFGYFCLGDGFAEFYFPSIYYIAENCQNCLDVSNKMHVPLSTGY